MKRYLAYAGGLAVLTAAVVFTFRGVEVDLTTDALATTTPTSALALSCTAPTVSAFEPSLTYTMTLTAATSGSPATTADAAIAISIGSGINGEAAGAISNATGSSGLDSTHLSFYHAAPMMKVGGIQCSANTQGQLEAYGDGADTALFDVGIDDVAASAYSSTTNQVDDLIVGGKLMLFGASGTAGAAAITDAADVSGANGEVVFGGATNAAAATGGMRIIGHVQYLGSTISGATETLTFVFTAS